MPLCVTTSCSSRADDTTPHALSEENDSWNRSAAVSWLLNHQGPDGAFFDVPTTSEVILALAQKSLMSVRELDCDAAPLGLCWVPRTGRGLKSSKGEFWFKDGNFDIEDEELKGRPETYKHEELENISKENSC
ncbi:hypothetical protein J6590_071548 [Homalodisca vitripennis]|nr:hypothetical protein J6590_071548 [Homalodisca vitripennis]